MHEVGVLVTVRCLSVCQHLPVTRLSEARQASCNAYGAGQAHMPCELIALLETDDPVRRTWVQQMTDTLVNATLAQSRTVIS